MNFNVYDIELLAAGYSPFLNDTSAKYVFLSHSCCTASNRLDVCGLSLQSRELLDALEVQKLRFFARMHKFVATVATVAKNITFHFLKIGDDFTMWNVDEF